MQLDRPSHPSPDQWLRELDGAFCDGAALLDFLAITPFDEPATRVSPSLRVPLAFAEKIEKGNAGDPLLRQVWPDKSECEEAAGFTDDPVGDKEATLGHGVIKKYRSRALVLTTSRCAVHCRFCFRKNTLPLAPLSMMDDRVDDILETLGALGDTDEVILSGGDPLMLEDRRLARLLSGLGAMARVRIVRLHTRMPTVLPSRVQEPLIEMIRACPVRVVFVLHVNHPNELGVDSAQAVEALRRAGALLLNQSVLLRGVNDDAGILARLSKKLVGLGVTPYYLHQLDRARGTHTFEVPIEKGRQIIKNMRACCAGYMVPKYVREIPGVPSKSTLE